LELSDSDQEVEVILSNPDYSRDDILVYHGNALHGNSKSITTKKIKKFRSKFERVYVVPGDKDWKEFKSKKLKSIGKLLDDEYTGDVIVPEYACGNLEVKEINDNLSMVFMDSNWFFSEWSADRDLNENCKITSRREFWSELSGTIGGLKAKQVVLFAGAPIFRNDAIGGKLSPKDHIFPLTNIIPWLYVPIPVVGTLISDTKNYLTPTESVLSPLYIEYIDQIKILLANHPQLTLVTSGTKLNTVYSCEGNHQINVNSSNDKATLHDDDRLIYQNDKASILRLGVEELEVIAELINVEDGSQLYTKTVLSGKPMNYDESAFSNFDSSLLGQKTRRQVRLTKDQVDLNSFIFGDLNRSLYKKEIEVTQLDLSTTLGGLTPLRMGGGKQTNSLRLQASNGDVYVARSLKKNPKKALPPGLDAAPLYRVMDHYFMAANPLAFLTTPTLDSAANIYHITPRVLLLPHQPNLSVFNDIMGDELVLFRERADEAWPNKKSFGYSKNIISSSSMLDKMTKDKATPDAKMFLRARLLDLVVGDWDRHVDQWRWAEGPGDNIYHPIARDRDQVYSNFNGFIIRAFRPYSINLLQLRAFDDELTRSEIRWMHWKATILDKYLLNELSEEEWKEETDYLQNAISPVVIRESASKLPDAYADQKSKIETNLTARFAHLGQIADDFRAEVLARSIVRASTKKDSIVIDQSNDLITIDLYTNYTSSKKRKKKTYRYKAPETKSIWIYGLKGDDVFHMIGDRNSNIDITIIGGYNADSYHSDVKYKNITIIDDEPKKAVEKNTKTKYRYSTDKLVHDVSIMDLLPLQKFFIPTLAYNTDDGLTVGGSYTWLKSGFKSNSTHILSADYMTGRNSSNLAYSYRKNDIISKTSSYVDAYWSGFRRQLNYYGGNGSSNTERNNFYRVGISDLRLEYGGAKHFNKITSISGGVYGWSAKVEELPNEFLTTTDLVTPDIFEREYFLGTKLGLELSNSNAPLRPTKLARLRFAADIRTAIVNKRTNVKFDFNYDYYKPLISDDRLIFSTKLIAGHIFGDYYLYEGFQLGGTEFLRGYRNGRFTGRSILAQNMNLQLKLVDRLFSKDFGCSAGISGGFDHGRTWSEFDETEDWQTSVGGGVWVSPFDIAVLSAGAYFSDENMQVRVKFNWQF